MPPKKIVTRSASHIKEDQSKRNFEEILKPWYVLDWPQRDYGIDSIVEITSSIKNSEDLKNEGKYFFAQLKATDKPKVSGDSISFSIQTQKINHWVSSNIPVLFVLNHLSVNTFYYLWIDEALLVSLETNNHLWQQQASVTLKIPKSNILKEGFHEELKSYVISFKRQSSRPIEVGQFFSFKYKCADFLKEFSDLSAPFNFVSTKSAIDKFKKNIEQSIYRVAIVGLSRVGKSSIVNMLLKKQVCPVGFFQTTSVPIQVIPDKEECIQILFEDKPILKQPYSFECIKEHASQEHNEDNRKKVQMVSISVLNQALQRGISIYDIPGLNDPDENIGAFSWAVATKANAIFYVIDAQPAEHGGFIFQKDYKNHILALGQSLDKIFVIFNKSDAVSPENLRLLKERVIRDLKKYNLYDKVADKIYYITTKDGIERDDLDSTVKLEEDLWNFIINENKYGIYRLSTINQEINKSCKDFTDLLKVRVLDNNKRGELEVIIHSIELKIPELEKEFVQRTKEFEKYLVTYLDNKKNKILFGLESLLRSIPVKDNFPTNNEIKEYLKAELNRALEEGNREYIAFMLKQKSFVDSWIESNLKQLREMLSTGAKKKLFDFNDIEEFETPQADLTSALGMSFLALVLTAALAPPMAIGAAIIAFFSSLVLTSEDIQAKKISKTLDKAWDIYDKSFKRLTDAYLELIEEQSTHIGNYTERKLQLFFDDIKLQIKKLQSPMSADETKLYELAFEKIAALQRKLQLLNIELAFYIGIL